ncbi:hypothetical protein chiPu_0029179, partial [Chiloscyllium punctatum]|nr:hypothetical protein [Chiloscyllium punctatum]
MISQTSFQDSMDGDLELEEEQPLPPREQQQTDTYYSLYRRH